MKPLTNPEVESTDLYREIYPNENKNTKAKRNRDPKWEKEKSCRIYSHPQLATEGAETLHAVGRVVALVTFKITPNWALLLKASQRQIGAVLSTDLRPEQHVPSGLVMVLPLVTKDKQSAMVRTRLEQSTDGAGAWGDDALCARSMAHRAMKHTMRESFDAISGERKMKR